MRIKNLRQRKRGARGRGRGRGPVTTPLPDDSDDTAYTNAVLDGTEQTYEPEEAE